MYKIVSLDPAEGFLGIGWRAIIQIGRLFYMLDLRDTLDAGTERMAFKCNAAGHVTNWHELYCRRGLPVSSDSLMDCLREFAEEQENG